MEQRPSWEVTSSSVSQEIPCILWNQKVHYRIHNSPIVNNINSVRALTSYFLKIHFKLSTRLRLGFPSSLFPSGSRTKACRHFAEYRSSQLMHLLSQSTALLSICNFQVPRTLINFPAEFAAKKMEYELTANKQMKYFVNTRAVLGRFARSTWTRARLRVQVESGHLGTFIALNEPYSVSICSRCQLSCT